jgi:hypothetical protein
VEARHQDGSPGRTVQRMNVNFPAVDLRREIDQEARRLGVAD